MNKKTFSETDIRTKFITPALVNAGWDIQKQVREEVAFTAGRIRVRGNLTNRGTRKIADYVLYLKPNIPLAIIEAKDFKHEIGSGMQQALDYAGLLDVPFVYSSNGKGFLEHDRTASEGTVEREVDLNSFPSPEELWQRYKRWKGIDQEKENLVAQPYHIDERGFAPRYYQRIAINRTIEAIAKGQRRILLVMATGTGKTVTAFQIIWRLWKAGKNKRILYLADRNILVDDPKRKYFSPFGDVVTKLSRRNTSKAHEIYFGLYQAVSGNEEFQDVYKNYSRDFFDLIIIDECHRGSASAESAWREILEYFHSATQIGMTATPRENKKVSNIDYFGDPLYTYSLKQGIDDGFLAPYKVVRFTFDRDAEGWRPTRGQVDRFGEEIPDREYNKKDYDRELVLDERTKLVARKVTEFLQETDRYSKSIIFCTDIDHAERMRSALINENIDLVNRDSRYVMRITGDEPSGKMELDNFMDPEETYPVIATTSKLLTTGVDIPTCKLIVLDSEINSMTEFKQIIGRGTRISEDYGKSYFTIMDFRDVTRLFADPDFDGDPVQSHEFGADQSPVPPPDFSYEEDSPEEDTGYFEDEGFPDNEDFDEYPDTGDSESKGRKKFYVDNVPVKVLNRRVQYYDEDGKLTTESLRDFSRKNIRKNFSSLDEFLRYWNSKEKKQAVVDELQEKGVFFDDLRKEVDKPLDPFDLVCHIAFDQPPLSRRERAEQVKKQNYFGKYSDTARKVLENLLEKYADEGLESLEDIKILKLRPFNELGTVTELVQEFGGSEGYRQAIQEIEQELYRSA